MKKILTVAFILILCLSMFTLLQVHSAGSTMGPYPDDLYYVVYPDPNAAVLALETGAIDLVAVATPEQASELASKGFSERFIHIPGGGDASFNFNHDLCNDKTFRQALAHLAPVDEVLAQYIYPLGARKYCFNGPSFAPWTTEEGLHIYDFDPAVAAEMLDAAGYRVHADGDVRTYPNGTKLRPISVMWGIEDPPQAKIYER
jgi:ABC-type transport system substrate-binding protein